MFTQEHLLLRQTVRSYAEKTLKPHAKALDETEGFRPEVFRELGELGILGVTVEMDIVAATLCMEELGRVCASTALSYLAHTMLCVHNIYKNGNAEQKKKYLPSLCKGSFVGAMCMSEPDYGSDAMGLQTRAEDKGSHFVLTGRKMFITNGPTADVFVIYARTGDNRELSSFIVEKKMKGISVGKKLSKLGMRASPTSEIVLEGVSVPKENVLGKLHDGFTQMQRTLNVERITISGISLGIARAALEDALSYAKDRKQFETPIIDFQLVQKLIADMYTNLEAARGLTYRAAHQEDLGKSNPALANACKVFAAEMATRASLSAIQVLGGYGYCKDYNVERYLRDAKLMEIGAGTSEVQRIVIAKALKKSGYIDDLV